MRADTADGSRGAAFLGKVLDDLVERFGDDAEVAVARGEYDVRRGRVLQDEELWERWTQAFLEWYVIERVPPGQPLPPAARALAEEADPRRQAAVRALLTSQRSLFEIRALQEGRVELLDLLGGGQYSVAEKRAMHGVSVGDVAEVRLIGFEDEVYFGRTFCFHPSGTRQVIIGHARRLMAAGRDRRDVIDFCATLRVRADRYKHVTPLRIYELGGAEPGEGAAR